MLPISWTLCTRSTKWGLWPYGQDNLFYRLWAQRDRQLRLKLLDDFHYSETTEMIFQEESGDKDTEPSYLCDVELDDELLRKALSSPLFTQEREEPANLRQTHHSHEESLLPGQSFFHTNKYGETRVRTKFNFVSRTEIKSRPGKQANQDSLWKTKEQILAEVRSEIQKHELQAESDRRSIQELTWICWF